MNLNISNPFFLQNEVTLKNDQLYIESTVLSRLLGVPYPHLINLIRVVVNQNRSVSFKLILRDHHQILVSWQGFNAVARRLLKRKPSLRDRVKRVNDHFITKNLMGFNSRRDPERKGETSLTKKLFRVKNQTTGLVLKGERIHDPGVDNHKAIIISHGLGSNIHHVMRYVPPLVKLGFWAFAFDFAGFGASEGSSVDTSVITEERDLIAVMKFVKERHFKKLTLMGLSQGGLVSALVANAYPRLINNLVLCYPAFSIPSDARHGHLQRVRFNLKHVPKQVKVSGTVLGPRYIRDAQELEPWGQIMNFRRPVLICHGNVDSVVPFKYSEKAYSTYKNAKLVTVKNGDHGFRRHGYHTAIKAIVNFLKMN